MMPVAIAVSFVVFSGGLSQNTLLAQAKLVTPPTNFTVDLTNEDDVILLWEDGSSGVAEQYIISRGLDPSKPLTEVATLPATETTFEDTEVEVGKTYAYRVSAAAPGYTKGDSEIITVEVTKIAAVENPGINSQVVDNPTSSGVIDTILQTENFWPNLLGLNLLLGGTLILTYIFIKSRLDAIHNKSLTKNSIANGEPDINPSPKPKISYDAKTGSPDQRIREEAFERYFNDRKRKLRGWEEFAKDSSN